MKFITILAVFSFLVITSSSHAFNPSSITFKITSSAATSTANLRIGVVKSNLAWDINRSQPIQGMPLPDSITSYFLTKSVTYTPAEFTRVLEIQVSQDTMMYVGSDLTNFLYIYSGAPRIYTIRP